MSTPNNEDSIFQDLPAEPPVVPETPEESVINHAPPKAKKKGFELKPVHFVIAGIVIAVLWIFWPTLFPKKPVATASNNAVLSPSDAMRNASQRDQATPDQSLTPQYPLNPPETGTTDQLMQNAAVGATPVPPAQTGTSPYTAAQIAQFNASAQRINDSITVSKKNGDLAGQRDAYEAAYNLSLQQQTVLTNQINDLNQQVVSLKTQQTRLVAASNTIQRPKPQSDKKVLVREPRPKPKHYSGATLSNYSINTIYEDQAFVETENEALSVKEGDYLPDGERVIKIDPNAHVIVTSRGLIK